MTPSLTAALEDGRLNLSANDHVLQDEGARRAEQIRTAAIQAFYEMDNDESARRVLVSKSRPDPGPWRDGDIVYWYRVQGSRTMSKRAQHAAGWRGPAIVLKQEGHSRVYVSYRGVPVLVAPHQLRKASAEELECVELSEMLDELLAQRPRGSVMQRNFIDARGDGADLEPPPPGDGAAPPPTTSTTTSTTDASTRSRTAAVTETTTRHGTRAGASGRPRT